jgi:Flp pilus assembly protein TadG
MQQTHSRLRKKLKDQSGVTLVFVALTLFSLVGFSALAVDLGYLYIVRNELQNAADAGALAGAWGLYDSTGHVDEGANQRAFEAATANKSGAAAVTVEWTSGNTGDVQRGHYRFEDGQFFPSDNLNMVQLNGVSEAELDANLDFVNAVRVFTRRPTAPSFFSKIFGYDSFALSAKAVAYIGFAGQLAPGDADQPMAVCKQALVDGSGNYSCGVGRMINSGANPGHETGGWTNFSQPCTTANTNTVKPLVCANGNPEAVSLGQGMGTTNGQEDAVFNDLESCWRKNSALDTDNDKVPDKPWSMTLPVIDCTGNSVSNCSTVVGAVELNLIWITQNDKNQWRELPQKMLRADGSYWACSYTKGDTVSAQACWQSFVDTFNLQDVLNNTPATYEDKTIYYLPDCKAHELSGRTGGQNFGILAKIPVLVE